MEEKAMTKMPKRSTWNAVATSYENWEKKKRKERSKQNHRKFYFKSINYFHRVFANNNHYYE